MSAKKYKFFLLSFVAALVLFEIYGRTVDSEILTIPVYFSVGLISVLTLLFFLLHAKTVGIVGESKMVSPSILFHHLSRSFIVYSVLYLIAMSITYRISHSSDTMITDNLTIAKKAAIDISKSAEGRLKAASKYYEWTGEKISYIGTSNETSVFVPNKIVEEERLKFVQTEEDMRGLDFFIVASASASLLSALLVGVIYFRNRKAEGNRSVGK